MGAHDQVQAPSEGTRLVPVLREIDGYDEEVLPANVYSSANLDVEPPVAVRQQLPGGFIDPSRNDVSSMEIWVSDTGNVLRVRLNQGTSMVHAMLLSAAKTWRFRPATLDGRPVPYKLEQRWVVTPP